MQSFAWLSGTAAEGAPTDAMSDAQLSPAVRRFEGVCVHIAYKGLKNRQAYAWYETPSKRPPRPPIFSRHVEFLAGVEELSKVKTWWKPEDVNRVVGRANYRTSASDLSKGHRPTEVVRMRNASWFIDVSHGARVPRSHPHPRARPRANARPARWLPPAGGTPNLWMNICHFSNSMFPLYEAAYTGTASLLPLEHVMMWQVGEAKTLTLTQNA